MRTTTTADITSSKRFDKCTIVLLWYFDVYPKLLEKYDYGWRGKHVRNWKSLPIYCRVLTQSSKTMYFQAVVGTPENSKEGTQARVHRNLQFNLEMNVLFSSGTALLDLSLSKAPFSQKPGPKQDWLTICLVLRMTSSSLWVKAWITKTPLSNLRSLKKKIQAILIIVGVTIWM